MSERLQTTAHIEARLAEDEERLTLDEQRLAVDEQRLLSDEARLEAEEQDVRENRIVAWLGVGLALAVTLAVVALVVAILAVRDDVAALGRSAPAGSVATESLRDESVTSEKLAAGAVTRDAIGGGAVAHAQLARDAVAGAQVAPDSLTGADILERTLATVPGATRAARASAAGNAERLGGLPAGDYLSRVVDVRATSLTDAQIVKGPLIVRCPAGARVISGGAAIEGAARGAAIVDNAPAGATGWTATARVVRRPQPAWRLVVTAICARGGA
jgi:hypothetical protein